MSTFIPITKANLSLASTISKKILRRVYQNILSEKTISDMLPDFYMDNIESVNNYFFNNPESVFVFVKDKSDDIVGIINARFFDGDTDVIMVFEFVDEPTDELRLECLTYLMNQFPSARTYFVDVYAHETEEEQFYLDHNFKVWDESLFSTPEKKIPIHVMIRKNS